MKLDKIKSLVSQDKRKSDRLNLSLRIFYKLPSSSEWTGPLLVENIGGDGLKLNSKIKLKKDTEINLKIELPHEPQPITVKGKIVWCREKSPNLSGYSIGIEFSKMHPRDRRKFIKYIGKNILIEQLNRIGTEP
ncbi:MAG: hypothetical protein B1H08_01795 [Candidatus Omnitrophica bacterium 4484_171]|nr:MAG: hypothetical protein B1H08_01795 [Candidatus Omnitrophica bacterium 4484_171]